MQLTKLDRWLKERFVYRTHLQTMRASEVVARGVKYQALPEMPGKRYRHLYICKTNQQAKEMVRILKEANLTFDASVVDSTAWYVKWIAPKDASLTWRIISIVTILSSCFFVARYLMELLSRPSVQKMLRESWETIQST